MMRWPSGHLLLNRDSSKQYEVTRRYCNSLYFQIRDDHSGHLDSKGDDDLNQFEMASGHWAAAKFAH